MKYLYLIILFAYVVGIVGGIGYTCWLGEYVIGGAVAILGAMAAPTAWKLYQKITE